MIYINLNRENSLSLSKQIYNFIRESIFNGTLKEGEKLPSTRELAKYHNIARNVVIESYEQLMAEGYIYAKNGSGTYVAEGISFKRTITHHYQSESKTSMKNLNEDIITFRTGIPELSSIPIKKWGKIYKEITLSISKEYLGYQDSYGEYELRYELSNYLKRVRGVHTNPENIIITTGAAQAFSLLCALIPKDEYALVENPLSHGILHTLKSNNVRIKTVPVDESGMITSCLPDISPKFIFTTPSHQFPTGVILPIKRRIEMIEYARNHNSYIVEDDYDSEFRFDGSPIQSMQNLDPMRVVYIGTFSKTLMPSLRMGYMVLPDNLCPLIEQAKYIADLHSPALEQLTMAKFIESGLFDLHIKKMKNIYLRKRNFLIKCIKENFGNNALVSGADAGMHLVVTFNNICFDGILIQKIKDNNLEVTPISKHYICDKNNAPIKHFYDKSLILGYGNLSFSEIEKGIKLLYKILSQNYLI